MSKDNQTTIKARDCDSLLVSKERFPIWQKLKGRWADRTNATSELKKIRREWDRKITKA